MENVIEVIKLEKHPDNWAEYNDGMYLIEESLELYIVEKAEPSYCPCTTDWLRSHIHDIGETPKSVPTPVDVKELQKEKDSLIEKLTGEVIILKAQLSNYDDCEKLLNKHRRFEAAKAIFAGLGNNMEFDNIAIAVGYADALFLELNKKDKE